MVDLKCETCPVVDRCRADVIAGKDFYLDGCRLPDLHLPGGRAGLVLTYLRRHGEATANEVAEAVGLPVADTRVSLSRLKEKRLAQPVLVKGIHRRLVWTAAV